MSVIKLENLTFCYPSGSENVFENLNAVIDTDWKLGLVGRNGRGKTTLLKLLAGEYDYGGKIISSVKFSYFPYNIKNPENIAKEVINEICPSVEEWEIRREISRLKICEDALYMPFSYLSGGEKTKMLLAAMFLNKERYLLLDEPTNHLDAKTKEQVVEYLGGKKNFIVVSHDRYLLDNCTDHTMAINKNGVEIRGGNFSAWFKDFEDRQAFEKNKNEKLKKEISRLKRAAEQSAGWANQTEAKKYGNGPVDRGFIGHKAAKMMKRSKVIDERRQKAVEEKKLLLKNEESAEKLKLSCLPYHSETLAAFYGVQVKYGETCVNSPVSFTVERGERVALSGGNGSGKSSILKALFGECDYNGKIIKGSGLVVSCVRQNTEYFNAGWEELLAGSNADKNLFVTILSKLGFSEPPFGKTAKQLSEGEKKRILIAKSLSEKAHLYVWDEPLNFIDVYCRIQIEQLIKDFKLTLLFVEHDKAFLEAVATKIVEIR